MLPPGPSSRPSDKRPEGFKDPPILHHRCPPPRLNMTNKGSPLEKPRPLEAVSATEAANPPDDPPKYTPRPKSLVDKGIPPLVTHSQLKAHLGLLRAFRGLELEVRNRPKERFPLLAGALGKEQRWVWFLELALERYAIDRLLPFKCHNEPGIVPPRFQRWVTGLKKLRAPDGTVDNPPLDVWLIWHAYMLNPTYDSPSSSHKRIAHRLCSPQVVCRRSRTRSHFGGS